MPVGSPESVHVFAWRVTFGWKNCILCYAISYSCYKKNQTNKQIKKTFDLGGDEWMELAEGLGLTPEEIRFLDKRTLNPMEAALSFIAKQRFLSVGELYELLNERDFPMLADLL